MHFLSTLTGIQPRDFLHERIWKPLEMYHTYFSHSDGKAGAEKSDTILARGYRWNLGNEIYKPKPWPHYLLLFGYGGTITNLMDYFRYLHAIINCIPLVSSSSYPKLHSPRSFLSSTTNPIPQI